MQMYSKGCCWYTVMKMLTSWITVRIFLYTGSVVFPCIQADNEPERQRGLCMLNEWSVHLLQLNVVVLVLHPTLPLNVPVISEAHTANLIIQRHSQTLYVISLLLILQLCSLQWQKAMIKEFVCVCLDVLISPSPSIGGWKLITVFFYVLYMNPVLLSWDSQKNREIHLYSRAHFAVKRAVEGLKAAAAAQRRNRSKLGQMTGCDFLMSVQRGVMCNRHHAMWEIPWHNICGFRPTKSGLKYCHNCWGTIAVSI